jgi:tRNA 2-selenouridine synthase
VKTIAPSQFDELFLSPVRWIDVRAPVEFNTGAMPGAVNLPLLTDIERHTIGIAYKKEGREAAVSLGHKLVSGETRQSRIAAWTACASEHANTVIYCFRGGMRSQIVQKWMSEAGIDVPLVTGGYKALRRYLMEVFAEPLPEFRVVSGPTGSGKTAFLSASGQPYLDLEGLAAHRGSSFGGMECPQPTQIDFEIRLAAGLLRLKRAARGPILIENESRLIGKCVIPDSLYSAIRTSQQLHLEVSLDQRVENIFRDYILESSLGQRGNAQRFVQFSDSVRAITRKLGGLRAQEVLRDLSFSHGEFLAGRGLDSNRIWIRKLLEWYYDPLYSHSQLKRNEPGLSHPETAVSGPLCR